jgi:hypothetical protein
MSTEVMDMTQLTAIPTFRAEDGSTIQFFPVQDGVLRQSSTHRVVFNGTAVDWLSAAYKPSRKTAMFFLEKHRRAA